METIWLTLGSLVFVVHLDLVLAQVLDVEALFGVVPVDLSMSLADGILVSQAEVVWIVYLLLSAYVHFQRTVLLDEVLSAIFSDQLGMGSVFLAFFLHVDLSRLVSVQKSKMSKMLKMPHFSQKLSKCQKICSKKKRASIYLHIDTLSSGLGRIGILALKQRLILA